MISGVLQVYPRKNPRPPPESAARRHVDGRVGGVSCQTWRNREEPATGCRSEQAVASEGLKLNDTAGGVPPPTGSPESSGLQTTPQCSVSSDGLQRELDQDQDQQQVTKLLSPLALPVVAVTTVTYQSHRKTTVAPDAGNSFRFRFSWFLNAAEILRVCLNLRMFIYLYINS